MNTEDMAHDIKTTEAKNHGWTEEMEEKWMLDRLHEIIKGREERL